MKRQKSTRLVEARICFDTVGWESGRSSGT